jgi:type II secretory pathway pseudopilin PulG
VRRGEAGSALVEALVATAVLAGVLGATFTALTAAQQRQAALDQRRTALMIARSRLAAVGLEVPAAPGDTEGVQGDFSWRVRIDPSQAETPAVSALGQPELVTVSVRALRGSADLAVLKSLRLATLAP